MKKEKNNRERKLDIRFTKREFNQIVEQANKLNVSKTKYVRSKIFKGDIALINPVEFLEQYSSINLEMKKIGNNINQLAKYANMLQQAGQENLNVIVELNSYLKSFIDIQKQINKLNNKILNT